MNVFGTSEESVRNKIANSITRDLKTQEEKVGRFYNQIESVEKLSRALENTVATLKDSCADAKKQIIENRENADKIKSSLNGYCDNLNSTLTAVLDRINSLEKRLEGGGGNGGVH